MAAFLGHVSGDPDGIARRLELGEILFADGEVVTGSTPFRGGDAVYLYRDLPPEVPVPGVVRVLRHDEATGLLAVDKPPFLATMPRGQHVQETVLTRVRRELDLPEAAPIHRLDRLTSGVLLLTTRREARRPYQEMVTAGGLEKTYEALAPLREGLPMTVRNRIVKQRGSLQAEVVPGQVNAHTELALVDRVVHGGRDVGRYRLRPITGKTHQLRVHLATLGIPICGDPLYPTVVDVDPGDFTTPLQLLATTVRFDDPVSGERREIHSRRTLPL